MAINLDKSGDTYSINLRKKASSSPGDLPHVTVHANLNWEQPEPKGFLGKLFAASNAPDLDLGCMFETQDGMKGVIQPLGNNFGSQDQAPYILLDKDDRSGSASDGENMFLYRPDLLKRVMFFAMIYEGANNFQSVGGRMRFSISGGETVTLALNNPDTRSTFCAAALITHQQGELVISKEERYFKSHLEADRHYQFGFRWVEGSK